MTGIDLDALSPDDIAARLSGPPEERAAFVRSAAEAGHAEAQAVYGQMLLDGAGVAQDEGAALDWFQRAAKLGNAKAINFVGSFHEDGWVVPRDMKKAARCYARAAQGGDFRGCFNHARMLGSAGRTAPGFLGSHAELASNRQCSGRFILPAGERRLMGC